MSYSHVRNFGARNEAAAKELIVFRGNSKMIVNFSIVVR